MYGAVADPPYDVRMITIDSYRIGAMQQIQKYGEIMNIPVSVVETRAEMQKQLALSRDADFVLSIRSGRVRGISADWRKYMNWSRQRPEKSILRSARRPKVRICVRYSASSNRSGTMVWS